MIAGLAAAGQARIEWADGQMPVLRSIRERFARERPLEGIAVGACLHVTAGDGEPRARAAGRAAPRSRCARPTRCPRRTTSPPRWSRTGSRSTPSAARTPTPGPPTSPRWSPREPQITLDDGADLSPPARGRRERGGLLGGTEETTTGLVRLRALEAEGGSPCPVIAVNEARTERAFNDRYGTGQSALDGILRATNLLLAGQTLVVLGYGWTGRGLALRARGRAPR